MDETVGRKVQLVTRVSRPSGDGSELWVIKESTATSGRATVQYSLTPALWIKKAKLELRLG